MLCYFYHSVPGHGESILKYCLAHSIVKLMEQGSTADVATKIALEGNKW